MHTIGHSMSMTSLHERLRSPIRLTVILLCAVLAALAATWVAPAGTAAAVDPPRYVTLVVTTDPDVAPVDQQQMLDKALLEYNEMANYWNDISNGVVDVQLADGPIFVPDKGQCGGGAIEATMNETKAAVGFQEGPQNVFIVNVGNCTTFSGVGYTRAFYVEDPDVRGVWSHEMGHSLFGFGHANRLDCTDGTVDATYGTDPGANPNCSSVGYGDYYDTMGSSIRRIQKGFSAPQAIRQGFYTQDEYVKIEGCDADRTVTIKQRSTEDDVVAAEIIDPRNDLGYYVEYVTNTEYDLNLSFGSLVRFGVRMLKFDRDDKSTLLLPGPVDANGDRYSNWAVGETFTSMSGGISMEVVSQETDQATVRIRTSCVNPTVVVDAASTAPGTPVQIAVLGNDTPATGSSLDATSVVFPSAGQPAGAQVSADGRTITVPGEGVYVADGATGVVTFTPEDGFLGDATAVSYQVTDANGATGVSTIGVHVAQPAPQAANDAVEAPFGQPIEIDVIGNDVAVDGTRLDPASVRFPATAQAAGAVVSADERTLQLPDQGTFSIEAATGIIRFTPAAGFAGTVIPVTYQVSSVDGDPDTATLAVTVAAAPPVDPGTGPVDPDPAGPGDGANRPAADLAATGGTLPLPVLIVGGVLVLGGAAALCISLLRRRRS